MIRRCRVSLLLLTALLLAGLPAMAQTTSGRHRPVRPVQSEAASAAAEGHRWFFMAGAGLMAGGDFFRVSGSATTTFEAPGGPAFESREFVVTLDETIDLALALGYRLHEKAWLRLNLSTAQMGMVALARVGQSASVYRWDKLDVIHTVLDLEYRLVRHESYPYLLAGLGVAMVGGVSDGGYDHSQPSMRIGAGYHQYLLPAWGLRAEVRNNLVSLDLDEYRPPIPDGAVYPDVTISDLGPHHFWEILLLMQGTF